MHKTPAGERRKSLIKEAKELAKDARLLEKATHAPSARQEAQRLQVEVESALAEAEALTLPYTPTGKAKLVVEINSFTGLNGKIK